MGYRVFKPRYTDKHTKERCQSPNYQIVFRDHKKQRRSFTGTPREQETNRIAQHIQRLVESRRTGGEVPADAKKWFDNLDAQSRKRLVDMDLIDPIELSADIPLIDHLEGQKKEDGTLIRPGFRQAMESRGATAAHVDPKIARIRAILDGVGFTYWRELILPGTESRITVWLGDKRAKEEIGGATFNYYIRDFKSFTRWLKGDTRVPSFALAEMGGVDNADVDAKLRRPLSVDEMRWLVTTTAKSIMRQRLTGEERARLYRFAFETGIRPGQIRALKVLSFDLKADPATVTSEAISVKRRRVHVQVIRASLAGELAKLFENKFPDALAIKMPKSPFHLAIMLRADLAEARQKWIDAGADPKEKIERAKSDFLAEVNRQNERAVFYSTRHGHGTALAAARVPEKDIAASMHHSSRKTTARYLHSDRQAITDAIAALPDLSYPNADVATGTDCFTTALPLSSSPMESGGVGSQNGRRGEVAEMPGNTGESAISDEKLKSGLLAELADALDSKSNARKGVSVRLR